MHVNSINPVRANVKLPDTAARKSPNEKKGNQATSDSPEKNGAISKNELGNAVEYSNKVGQMLKRKLNFSIDETTEKVVVKVIDEESGEVVRQVPPQEMLRIASHLKELQEMNDRVMSAVKSVILDLRY